MERGLAPRLALFVCVFAVHGWATEVEAEDGYGGAYYDTDEDASEGAERSGSEDDPPQEDEEDASFLDDLDLDLHGYYRARLVWTGHHPRLDPMGGADLGETAAYGFMRLRLEPSVSYAPDPERPVATLRMQIDGLDDVVFGDNARLASTPIFAGDPSATDVDGVDVDTLQLKRAWIEVMTPVGQLRVGRMPSQWGVGILTSDGNGFTQDFGDPQVGSTYDRVLFATRPLTIARAIADGDRRPTPLVVAFAYDRLVEDQLGPARDPYDPEIREAVPFGFLTNGDDDVEEIVTAVAWSDREINPRRRRDELSGGLYYIHRWQTSSESYVHIFDAFWRVRYAVFGSRAPSLFTEGEVLTIQGKSKGISIRPGFDETTGRTPDDTNADIWGAVARAGVAARHYDAFLEAGYASGDSDLMDADLTGRAMHADHHVGLLLYPVVLAARTAYAFGEDLKPLWSRGGVYNSKYLAPHVRVRVGDTGLELVGAAVFAWADELTVALSNSRADGSRSCGFEGDCFLGVEIDLAAKLRWGPNDLVQWSTELGFLHTGGALATVLRERDLWTVQSRIALVF